MATPLTDGINALTQYANETTGKQDTTLSDAVGSLVDGYGGGNIKKTEYTFVPASGRSYTCDVAVTESEDKILFAHWYDPSVETYPTNDTPYEAIHIGKAMCKFVKMAESSQWCLWRTNTSGSITGVNNYGKSNPFYSNGAIIACSNPPFYGGQTYVLEVYSIE